MWKLLSISTFLVNIFLTVSAGDVQGPKDEKNTAPPSGTDVKPAEATFGIIKDILDGTPKKCAINEKFEKCPVNRCQPQLCEHVGIPQCSSHDEKYYNGKEEIYGYTPGYGVVCGPPACICIDNYVRNPEGVCIPATLCPSCGNDKNATYGCGNNCGRRCSNYNKKPGKCAKACYLNSCDCKKDYVLDDYTGLCVLPKDCSNKDAPEPEKTDKDSEDDNSNDDSTKGDDDNDESNDDPCSKCDEENCDKQDMKDHKLDGGETCGCNKDKECSDKDDHDETSTPPKSTTQKSNCTTKNEESWTEYFKNKFTFKTEEPCTEEEYKLSTATEQMDTTSDSSETTESTTKSSEDCKGKYELYVCASFCPQKSCAEYLNGTRCHMKTKPAKKCEKECRCRAGYYRDEEDNCVSARDCRRTTTVKPTTPNPDCEDATLQLFVKGNIAYTINILRELSLSRPGVNVLCAGASILSLTSELALMATGDAKTQLISAINFKEMEQMRCFFPKLFANLTVELRYIEYKFHSNIYADDVCQLSDDFKTTIKKTFKNLSSVPENIDFTSPESAQQITETVAQKTNDQIPNCISTETLTTFEKGLLLLDAQSFKGQLEKPFDPADTMDADFFSNGRVTKKPTMNQRGKFMYTESLIGTQMVSLKYKKGRPSEAYELVVVIPNARDGLKDLMSRLANPDVLLSALDKMRLEDVEIFLPKINVTVANNLKMPSEKAKMDLIFNKNSTGLEDIAACETPVVNEILQRCVLEVGESNEYRKSIDYESKEDAAQNKFLRSYLFKADHPFFYAVFLNKIMLLAGTFVR